VEPAFARAAATEALPQFLAFEREKIAARDVEGLASMWAPDSRVVDARNTPDSADDYVWEGRAAVVDRYIVAVFAHPPPLIAPPQDVQIELIDPAGNVKGCTPGGDERETDSAARIINGQDCWYFARRNGRWWAVELIYNVPAALQ
jgi:hypothetical protein